MNTRPLVRVGCLLMILATGSRAQTHSTGPVLAPRQTVHVDGPASCNCSGSDTHLDLCHVAGFALDIGGASVWASTGLGTSCGSEAVPPGRCVYYRYSFSCVDHGALGGWVCHLQGARVTCGDASPTGDC